MSGGDGGKHGRTRRGEKGRAKGVRLWDGHEKLSGGEVRLDAAATVRAAAPYQKLRREAGNRAGALSANMSAPDGLSADAGPDPGLLILPGDYRLRRISARTRAGILFVVDASRSQGADRRLSFAKGAVLSLLAQAYCTRDQVGLIAFGGSRADVLLPLTRSVEYAVKHLEHLSASGNTPVAMGLRRALELLETEKKHSGDFRPFLILLTDGKANFDALPGDPYSHALTAAGRIRKARIPALVVDTETGCFSLGLAKKLAQEMGGEYRKLW